MSAQPDDLGIDVEHVTLAAPSEATEGFSERAIVLAPEADEATILALLAALPVGRGLGWFDIRMPSPSDPGVYLFSWRADEGYRIAWGSHGWSTYTQRVAPEDVATHVMACMRQLPAHDMPPLSLTHADFGWKLRPAPWYARIFGAKPRVDAEPEQDFRDRVAAIRAAREDDA